MISTLETRIYIVEALKLCFLKHLKIKSMYFFLNNKSQNKNFILYHIRLAHKDAAKIPAPSFSLSPLNQHHCCYLPFLFEVVVSRQLWHFFQESLMIILNEPKCLLFPSRLDAFFAVKVSSKMPICHQSQGYCSDSQYQCCEFLCRYLHIQENMFLIF